jgi:hypothetical protein
VPDPWEGVAADGAILTGADRGRVPAAFEPVTTDRSRAARRWGEIEAGLAAPLGQLLSWATAERRPAPGEVRLTLADDGIAAAVADRFAGLIGLWPDDQQNQ